MDYRNIVPQLDYNLEGVLKIHGIWRKKLRECWRGRRVWKKSWRNCKRYRDLQKKVRVLDMRGGLEKKVERMLEI